MKPTHAVLTFAMLAAGLSGGCCVTQTRPDVAMTAETQATLTPQAVIEKLTSGNAVYVAGKRTVRNTPARMQSAIGGQHPMAIVLSCIDSRVPVEDIFDCGLGDMFVARVAGNFVNQDMLGSMEYACKKSGAKVIVVLGHGSCGAVKSAISDVRLGNITPMLANIKPAVNAISEHFEGEKSAKNPAFVHAVCVENVRLTLRRIRDESPTLKDMEDAGEIKIVGAIYDLHTGAVTFPE